MNNNQQLAAESQLSDKLRQQKKQLIAVDYTIHAAGKLESARYAAEFILRSS
jgi:hypothetical protein